MSSGLPKGLGGNAGNTGDVGLISGLGRAPGIGRWQAILAFLPGKFHETEEPGRIQSMGVTKSDMTEAT